MELLLFYKIVELFYLGGRPSRWDCDDVVTKGVSCPGLREAPMKKPTCRESGGCGGGRLNVSWSVTGESRRQEVSACPGRCGPKIGAATERLDKLTAGRRGVGVNSPTGRGRPGHVSHRSQWWVPSVGGGHVVVSNLVSVHATFAFFIFY